MTECRTIDDLADLRAGDKGDTLIIAVIARDREAYQVLVENLSVDRVVEHYGHRATRAAKRTLQENVMALVFELPGILGGGVTGSPALDGHGKTMSYHLLSLHI